MYTPFCGRNGSRVSASVGVLNGTNTSAELQKIVGSYVDPFEFMGDNVLTFIFGFLSMISILAVLAVSWYAQNILLAEEV